MVAGQRTEKYGAWIRADKNARKKKKERKAYGIIHIPQCF